MTPEEKEKRNKRIGWLVSFLVQFLLLLIFYFLIAWKAPFPPIPEYGIELNIESSAGIETGTPTPETQTNDVVEEGANQTDHETVSEINKETNPLLNEPAEVEPNTEAETLEPVAELAPLIAETTPTIPDKEEEVPKPKIDERALMKATTSSDSKNLDEDIVHEQNKTQELDNRAIYNNDEKAAVEDVASLSLAGWVWERPPKPDDNSIESGKIVFNIVVNGEGYITSCNVANSNITPAVVKKYRDAILSLSFRPTVGVIPETSTGQITFIIKSK